MRKFVVLSFIILAFGTFSAAHGQGVLSEILRRMDQHNRALQSVKADVTMVKTNAQLGESDTYKGTTSYLPKSPLTKNTLYVRIDWSKPVEEQISLRGDSYELYRPRLNQAIVGKTNSVKGGSESVGGALAFMSMTKDQLKTNYDVVYIGEELLSAGAKTWHLQLTPKAKTSYKTAELWVDGDGMPRQAKIVERNDDSTTVQLSDIRKNQRIDTKIFSLRYDKKKTKIVQG